MIKSKNGFTVIEVVASIFLITLILTTGMLIIMNMRNQSSASEKRIQATDIGSLIRNDILSHTDYDELNTWLNGNSQVLTSSNCNSSGSPIDCNVFLYTSGETSFEDNITITFLEPTTDSINYQIIHYEIEIIYFNDRTMVLTGAVYEKA
ncbi:MAG: type II secretion system GspH family protein [Acholeplasmataceae bacterium]|nr:type II secretion system GspH family protein [Acholeplasmataceae bacterium]